MLRNFKILEVLICPISELGATLTAHKKNQWEESSQASRMLRSVACHQRQVLNNF